MNKHSAPLQWFLVSNCGFTLPLHQTMISLGREHCDVILKSPSADGKHAVITYDHYEKRFKVKDLNTLNGTYVNDIRIPVHTFVMLQHLDCLRFGFDAVIYQLQGIPRLYSGPNLSHYNHSSTINNNYYSPNISSSWTSPYISSPHLIINKMADCRNCECKQDVQKSKQQYIGNVGQSSREASELLFSPDSSKHSVRQDYCGNIVSQQSIPHNNALCNLSDANKRNQCIDGQISDPLKNGHCSLNSSPSECPQRTYSFNSLPLVNLQDESCASGDQCAEKIINSGTIVKSCHRRSASCDPISTGTSDFQTATRHQSLTECGSNSGKESIKEEEKINEMVVMKAEKPYVQSEAITDRGTNNTDVANDGGGCRPLSTAFTIDFADNTQATLSLKKLDIKDSISKFAPPKPECEMKAVHRRNLSLPKKENGKDPVWDLSNSYGLGPSRTQLKESLGPVRGGYLSEGHMSSDQDDELSAKSDPTRKATIATDKEMMKAPVSTPRKIQELKAAKNVGRRSLPVTGLRDSAKYLISRMFGEVTAPPSSPSDPPIISPVGPVSKLTLNIGTNGVGSNLKKGDVKNNSRSSLTSTKTYTVDGRELGKSPTQAKTNLAEVQVEEFEGLEDEVEEDDGMKMEDENDQTYEDGSETGTYTIEKDGDNGDEVKEARKNIDIVFGLKSQNANYEDETRGSPDICDEKQNKVQTPSKPNSSWLKEWAASSADIKTNQLPLVTSPMTQQEDIIQASSTTPWTRAISLPNSAPPFASSFSTSTPPEAPQRPRRRLPVIPTEKLNALPPSVHFNGMNSPKTGGEMTKGYSFSNRSSPEGGNPSDSASMDTETILKDTETVVSAMEARMDNQRLLQKISNRVGGGRDSGGESDVDTSTASASNEVELRPKKLLLHKKVAAQLKSQLKSFEDDSCFEARSLSPRTARRSLMGSVSSHGRTTPTDSVSEVETASVQSDISSSSELSGSSPVSKRKHRESAPLMRFNRAFSLRRARLGCESESPPVPSPVATAVAKTPNLHQPSMSQSLANSRPSSANSVSSSKGRAVHSNKSDSGSSSSVAVKKSSARPPPISANNSFNRSDGGRFSLRLPRSAGPPPRPSSAKTPSTHSTPQPAPRVKSAGSSARSGGTPRSNSTLSAKELELKNWKRRKEYDPLKAAAEGRKKDVVKKPLIIPLVTKSESPSPTSTSFHRSASFHGTDALNGGGTHLRRNTFSLEDSEMELNSSDYHLDTPTHRHTMSDFECEIPGVSQRSRGSRKSSEDELEATRTMSHTDLDVEPMTISPRDSPQMHSSIRHKNKVDALDNLVISTIYQLSCHLRGNAEQLLGKLRDSQKGEDCLETKGLHEILERIALEDSPVSSPQGRSVSKQLSGILKNLKRIEESIQIVDQVVSPVKNCQLKKLEGSSSSLHSHKKWNGFKDKEYY